MTVERNLIEGSSYKTAFVGKAGSVRAYTWSSSAGFGVLYPSGGSLSAWSAFSPKGNAIVSADNSSTPSGTAVISVTVWTPFGFGSSTTGSIPGPTSGQTQPYGVAFSPSGASVAIAARQIFGSSPPPGVFAFPWSSVSGVGTRFSNPSTLPSGITSCWCVAFSPAGDAIAVGYSGGFAVYAWSDSTGFGAKYSDPSGMPSGNAVGVAFTPSADAIMFVSGGDIYAYQWNSSTGFGTKYTSPLSSPTASGSIDISPDGRAVVIAGGPTSGITAYPWTYSGGFGTKFSDPATSPSGPNTVKFAPDNGAVMAANGYPGTPNAYQFSTATGFGSSITVPSTLNSLNYGFAFTPK